MAAESQQYGIFRLGFHELHASLFAFKHKVKDQILRFKKLEWRTKKTANILKEMCYPNYDDTRGRQNRGVLMVHVSQTQSSESEVEHCKQTIMKYLQSLSMSVSGEELTSFLKPSSGFSKDMLWGLLVISEITEVQNLQSGDSSEPPSFNFASAGSCSDHNWAIRIEDFIPLKKPAHGVNFIASAKASLNTAPQFWTTCRISIDMFDTEGIEPETKALLSTDFLSELERKISHTDSFSTLSNEAKDESLKVVNKKQLDTVDEISQNPVDVILHSLPRNYNSEWRRWLSTLLPYLSNIDVSLHGVDIHRSQLLYTCNQILSLPNADGARRGFMCSELGSVCQNVFLGGEKHVFDVDTQSGEKRFWIVDFHMAQCIFQQGDTKFNRAYQDSFKSGSVKLNIADVLFSKCESCSMGTCSCSKRCTVVMMPVFLENIPHFCVLCLWVKWAANNACTVTFGVRDGMNFPNVYYVKKIDVLKQWVEFHAQTKKIALQFISELSRKMQYDRYQPKQKEVECALHTANLMSGLVSEELGDKVPAGLDTKTLFTRDWIGQVMVSQVVNTFNSDKECAGSSVRSAAETYQTQPDVAAGRVRVGAMQGLCPGTPHSPSNSRFKPKCTGEGGVEQVPATDGPESTKLRTITESTIPTLLREMFIEGFANAEMGKHERHIDFELCSQMSNLNPKSTPTQTAQVLKRNFLPCYQLCDILISQCALWMSGKLDLDEVCEFGLKISSLAENQPSPTGFDSKDVDGETASPGQGVDSVNGGQQAEDANEEADDAASNSEREGENDNGSEEEEESGGTKSKTGNLKSIPGWLSLEEARNELLACSGEHLTSKTHNELVKSLQPQVEILKHMIKIVTAHIRAAAESATDGRETAFDAESMELSQTVTDNHLSRSVYSSSKHTQAHNASKKNQKDVVKRFYRIWKYSSKKPNQIREEDYQHFAKSRDQCIMSCVWLDVDLCSWLEETCNERIEQCQFSNILKYYREEEKGKKRLVELGISPDRLQIDHSWCVSFGCPEQCGLFAVLQDGAANRFYSNHISLFSMKMLQGGSAVFDTMIRTMRYLLRVGYAHADWDSFKFTTTIRPSDLPSHRRPRNLLQVPHFGDELNRGNSVKSETLWLRSQIRYALDDDEKKGRFVEKVYKEGEIFPEFRIHAGFQLMQEDPRTGHQFVIPAPALNIRFTGVAEGWTLWSGQPIVEGSFITWYCGPSVTKQDLPILHHMPASTDALMTILKTAGLAHLTTHMATVKKGNLIVDCLPSTVCDANQTNRHRYSLEFICTTGGVQAFANDARHKKGAKINTFRRVLQEGLRLVKNIPLC